MLSGLSRVRVLQAIFDVGLPNREYSDSWKNLTGPGHPGGAGLPLQERLCPEDGLLLPGCPPDLVLMPFTQPDESRRGPDGHRRVEGDQEVAAQHCCHEPESKEKDSW